MFAPRLTNCKKCAEIPNLLALIDCKIALEANKLYQNIRFMLNRPVDNCTMTDLIHYKRILTYKYFNQTYACHYSIEQIADKVLSKTAGINSPCNNQK